MRKTIAESRPWDSRLSHHARKIRIGRIDPSAGAGGP